MDGEPEDQKKFKGHANQAITCGSFFRSWFKQNKCRNIYGTIGTHWMFKYIINVKMFMQNIFRCDLIMI